MTFSQLKILETDISLTTENIWNAYLIKVIWDTILTHGNTQKSTQ